MKKVLVVLAVVFALVIGLWRSGKSVSQMSDVLGIAPTPTPFAFEELTMPYLRGRGYQSRLGELAKVGENSQYVSYLTSYDSDGLKVNGLLTVPKNGEQKHPAIVFVHGYVNPSTYSTRTRYAAYVDYLAKNGFVVFKIDLRGHGSSEGEPGGAYYSSDYVIDTLNAYSALQNYDRVDPERIGLWGHSMAGNVTFRGFVAKGDIKALVIWAGAGYTYDDLKDYRIMDTSYRAPRMGTRASQRRAELRAAHGEFAHDDPFWRLVPATNYLGGVSGGVELHHAVNDDVVSVEYSRNLMKLLDSTSIDHQSYEYATGGHNISGTSFNIAMRRTVEFFRAKLVESTHN